VPSRVLVLISADPRETHKANEALRIALGVVAGETPVEIVLTGRGAKLLDAGADDYVDGDDIVRHLATLKKLGQRFHAAREAVPTGDDWNPEGHEVVPVSAAEIAELVAGSERVLAF